MATSLSSPQRGRGQHGQHGTSENTPESRTTCPVRPSTRKIGTSDQVSGNLYSTEVDRAHNATKAMVFERGHEVSKQTVETDLTTRFGKRTRRWWSGR
jgi:hypothetical protein